MLRQHHVKIQDLAPFLRGYDPSKPQSAEDWSKTESAGFSPGMLLFCLERVSAPQGLAFGKRDDAGETYRVRDLCVVVGKDNNRPLVVNITASAFELRFLEVLMLEKARKAILDGKDFVYVAAKPAQPLSEGQVREIADDERIEFAGCRTATFSTIELRRRTGLARTDTTHGATTGTALARSLQLSTQSAGVESGAATGLG